MSAKDRAYSRFDREDLQEMLSASVSYGRDTRYRKARESKLVYLDELFSDLDLGHIGEVLTYAVRQPGISGDPRHMACSKVVAGFLGRNRLYEKPQQVKQRAPELKALIVEGYQELEGLGYGIPKQTNDSE